MDFVSTGEWLINAFNDIWVALSTTEVFGISVLSIFGVGFVAVFLIIAVIRMTDII